MQKLSAFLEVEVTHRTAEQEGELFKRHATSSSPNDFIGKWQRNLDASQIKIIEQKCSYFFDEFGYS